MKGKTRGLRNFLLACSGQSGSVAVLVALLMIVIFGMMAFGIDMGVVELEKRKLQTVADAAAIAGASELKYEISDPEILTAAHLSAKANTFVDEAGNSALIDSDVVINRADHTVTVTARRQQSLYFARILGISTHEITANAVAGFQPSTNCIYALNPSASQSLLFDHASGTLRTDCGIIVNSSDDHAIDTLGLVGVSINAPYIGVVNFVDHSRDYNNWDTWVLVSYTGERPVALSEPVDDPLEHLPAPTRPPTPPVIPAPTVIVPNKLTIEKTSPPTLSPKDYQGGIEIRAGGIINGTNVTFSGGNVSYKFGGSGLSLSKTSITNPIPATVTFYAGTYKFDGPISISSGNVTFRAGNYNFVRGLSIAGGNVTFENGTYNFGGTGLSISQGALLIGTAVTLNTGTYNFDGTGLSISGGTVNLGSGTYFFSGSGGLNVSNGVMTGTGVMFYNGGDGSIKFTGLLRASSLSAPTSGPYTGILFWQVKNQDVRFSGIEAMTFQGALYFPNAKLSIRGLTLAQYTMIVADKIVFDGGLFYAMDYNDIDGQVTPLRDPAKLIR